MTDFEPDRSAITAGFQLSLERAHKVADFFVIDIQVAVACHPKLVAAFNIQAREQLLNVHPDDR